MIGIGAVCLWMGRFVLRQPPCTCAVLLRGKTVLITGGSQGIGLAVSLDLARRGARIIIASRDAFQGHRAVQKIRDECNIPVEIEHHTVDLADLNSVSYFAEAILSRENYLDILINNAGPFFNPAVAYSTLDEERTPQGYDRAFATNYLGHFLLTHLLMGLLLKSSYRRIINVSSASHAWAPDLNFSVQDAKYGNAMYPHLQGYDTSKLALVLHAKFLSYLYSKNDVVACAVHPGLCLTSLWFNMKYFYPLCLSKIFCFLIWPFSQSPQNAAQSVIHCVVSPDKYALMGKYIEKCKAKEIQHKNTKNLQEAELLWNVSFFLSGLQCKRRLSLSEETKKPQCYDDVRNPYVKNEVKPLQVPSVVKIDERYKVLPEKNLVDVCGNRIDVDAFVWNQLPCFS
ncbi:hypothetical protein CAPTEDRAFT_220435 [Capitella teleta]|uniref:Uncharacterized protein n=1 Tax=Capitella teleta TaxID=283909 RepID=R7V597_CAPTE|nr:hypothetical protein CAPTEDRAFT_220435 [Capitella teleta]|eukprot:ELU13704.1 hypothetical protein CAPTEDRAFT_220435 [Capitella teleta]